MKDLERIDELKHIKQLLMIQSDFYNFEYEQMVKNNGVTELSEIWRKKLRAVNQALRDIEFVVKIEEY